MQKYAYKVFAGPKKEKLKNKNKIKDRMRKSEKKETLTKQ